MRQATLWLTVGFLGNGFAQFLQKYLHAVGLGSYQGLALVVMYAAGALFALALMLASGGRVGRKEAIAGMGVGLCSYLGSFSALRALGSLPAYTVFPFIVGGPIVLVALYSWLVKGERLSGSARYGILCGIVAAALLSLG